MGGGISISGQSAVVTPTTSPTEIGFGFRTTEVLLRAAAANATDIYVNLGSFSLINGNIIVRAGETVSVSIADLLQLKILMGKALEAEDFITKVRYTAAGAGVNTLYIDALGGV